MSLDWLSWCGELGMFVCPKLSLRRVPSELHDDSDFHGQVCACRSDELLLAWTLKPGHKNPSGHWWW